MRVHMKNVLSTNDVFTKGKLPQTEREWLALDGIKNEHVEINGLPVQ